MTCDVCTDCAGGFTTPKLFRCGRTIDGDWIVIRLCIDCLYRVNPYMQRDLIEAAYEPV